MHPLLLLAILIGGFLAGIINTMAGGGSFITLPLLIFAGLPAHVANGTNRVAIVMQNVGATAGFRRKGVGLGRNAWFLLLPSLAGGYLGARIAVDVDEAMLRRAIGIMLCVMLPFTLRRAPRGTGAGPASPPLRWWTWPVYFAIGIYGGFLQAGVGFFYLALLVGVDRMDLVRANLVKVFLVLVYSLLALGVFFMEHQVHAVTGLVLAVGNMAGGWVGAHMAVDKGERWIRAVLIVGVAISAAQLTGFTRWVLGLVH